MNHILRFSLFLIYDQNRKRLQNTFEVFLDNRKENAMSNLKENASFFTKKEIHGIEYAQKEYDMECLRFRMKLVCAGISLLSPLSFLVFSIFGDVGIWNVIETLMIVVACGATLAANPIISLRTVWKFGVIGYWIVPFLLINFIGFILGIFLALMLFIVFPTFYCVIGLIQSYRDKKDTRTYLELFHIEHQEEYIK